MTGPAVTSDQNSNETNTTEQQDSNVNNDPFAAERVAIRQAALNEAAAIYQPLIQDHERQRQTLEQRLNSVPTVQTPDDPSSFLQNPQSEVRSIIKNELEQSLAPLNSFMHSFQKQNVYAQIKQQIKVHPHLSNVLPQVESYLDQQYQMLNNLDANSVSGLMMTILGQINAGFLAPLGGGNNQNNNNNNNNTQRQPNPSPNTNVNPPVNAPRSNDPNMREPTENERAVMKMNGFKDFAEYLKFMNVS